MSQQDQNMRETMRDENGNTNIPSSDVSKPRKGVLHKMGKIAKPTQWKSGSKKSPGSFSPDLQSAAMPPVTTDKVLPPIQAVSDLRRAGPNSMNGAIVARAPQSSTTQRVPQGGSGNKLPVPRKSISGPELNPYVPPTVTRVRNGTIASGQVVSPAGPSYPVPPQGRSQHAMTNSALSQRWEPGPDFLPRVDVNGGLFLDPDGEEIESPNRSSESLQGNGTYTNMSAANNINQTEIIDDTNMAGGQLPEQATPRRNNTWEEPSTRIPRSAATTQATVPVLYNLQAENERLKEALRRAQEDKGESDRRAEKLTNNSLVAVQGSRQWEALQKELDVARQKLEQLDTSLRTESQQHAQSKEALAEAQSNFNVLQTSMETLQEEYKWLKDEHENLKVDHDSAVADRLDLLAAQEECLQTIDRLRGDFGPHLDDEHFIDCYDKLRRDIERWSVDYFKGPISALPSPGAALMEMSDDCDEYLQSQLMRPKLVQSYVWSVLNTKVFACNSRNNPGFWWAHSRRNQFSGLVALLQPTESQRLRPQDQDEKPIREYHRWRAITARLLESKIKYPEIARTERFDDDIIDSTLNALKAIRSDDGRQKSHTDGAYTRKLYEIFYQAITMDQEMNKQFAFYTIEMPALHVRDHNQNLINALFDATIMEVDTAMIRADGSVECRFVGLVLSPMLLKPPAFQSGN
ncbi:hypothetical protein E2P81_ATG04622 [Venturia nashicola]|nr:hypothetical protein E2P81_ATG04622 [Venturia nashicola]